ncbi:hypothetical protein [Halomarina litorea]|uniref:hypothetical protein n=1 Tax=Halomarina litorea TaxID=2961595 RepID=UPI003F5E6859
MTPGWGLFAPLIVPDEESRLQRWLATHPDTGERVERLVERAERAGRERGRRIEVQ